VSKAATMPALAILAALMASACSHMPSGVHDALQGALPANSSEERVHEALALLERGEAEDARRQLEAVLRRDPGNHTAQRLLEQINGDPRAQLGARSRRYVVREGDTMSGLAERYLGDPLLFYALARYNNIAPRDLAAGATLMIPERARAPSAAASRAPTNAALTAAHAPAPPAAITPAPSVPTNTQASARANQLRLQGLERLNAGDAGGAVALLQQARALDGANPAIQSDLSRAQRIQASLGVR
jgi:hypothetical protein